MTAPSSQEPTARRQLAEERGWRYEHQVTLTVPDHLARHLGLPADQHDTEVTDYVAGYDSDYSLAIYSAGAATVWCVYLPASYPSTSCTWTKGHTELARSALTDQAQALIAALPTTAGAIEGEHLWISTTADSSAYRDDLHRVLPVVSQLLELTAAIVTPHSPAQAKFFVNRDRVRRFRAAWHIPEVVWNEWIATSARGLIEPDTANRWLSDHEPYQWFLGGEPRVTGLTKVMAEWRFSAGHEFESLDLRIDSLCDPDYLAEKLSLAAAAAAFPGWQPGDLPSLRDWIRGMTDMEPHTKTVGGYKRLGFVLFDLDRILGAASGVITTVKITLTDKAIDGTPLDIGGGRSRE